MDANTIYAESQYGVLVRYDKPTGQELVLQPLEGKGEPALRWNWDSPIIISPHSHTRLYFAANKLFPTGRTHPVGVQLAKQLLKLWRNDRSRW